MILAEARGAAQTAVAVARGRLLDHKGRRATFGFVLNELEEFRRAQIKRKHDAATKIQAVYRGFRLRLELERFNYGVKKFQARRTRQLLSLGLISYSKFESKI